MGLKKILVANRGEIAIRIARAAHDLGIEAVMVHSSDDAGSMHVDFGVGAVDLGTRGVPAYLNQDAILDAAEATGCDAVHPGYGFLSENADFAAAVEARGFKFIGPDASVLSLLGDKVQARLLAERSGVPVSEGSASAVSLEVVRDYLLAQEPGTAIMLKPVSGGGGRGMAVVTGADDLEAVFKRCQAEALAAFGLGDLYFERLVRNARHVEVQVIGDGQQVAHLWERECSLQRRHQKLIEMAPAPGLDPDVRNRILDAAVGMAREVGYRGLATFEFLVDERRVDAPDGFVFLECNPRLQVEHTVTEEITGIDLVSSQIQVIGGSSLADLSLDQHQIPQPKGIAMQARINAETYTLAGGIMSAGGSITELDLPTGPGIRVDTCARRGFTPNPAFDSLIAKVIVHARTSELVPALDRMKRALSEFHLAGLSSNREFLDALLSREEVRSNAFDTGFVDRHLLELISAAGVAEQQAIVHDRLPDGLAAVYSPMRGIVSEILVTVGDEVHSGDVVGRVEAMKMEHPVTADETGIVREVCVNIGDAVENGGTLVIIESSELTREHREGREETDPDAIRADLAALQDRLHRTVDAGRPAQVQRRHRLGHRTARENIDDLIDPGSFSEYGALAIAAQRARRSYADLVESSPADGLICGIASINGGMFPARSSAAVLSYDWTVFGGTQGMFGHMKTDRILEVAYAQKLPVVFFAEGGGGRPGETEYAGAAGLDVPSFWHLGRLRGRVPTVGIANRYCFAGNAAMLAMCELVIATRDSNIGMGGPAMIEGGGLGKVSPNDIGPAVEQNSKGVVDVLVEDEAEAVAVAKQYLSYFQGETTSYEAADQRVLRHLVPENRKHPYNVKGGIESLADVGSVLELKAGFGAGAVTVLARIEGTPVGIIANNPMHLGGAIDADAASKATALLKLCQRHGLPVIQLVDTPGFMVGVEAERTGQAGVFGEYFVTGTQLTVPTYCVVLRKAYGLGAMAVAGGSMRAPQLTVSWPTGEFGPMGFEGAVRLAYGKQLEQIADDVERQAKFDEYVNEMYRSGAAISMAEYHEIDAVIDPAETRQWLARALKSRTACPASE